MALRKLGYSGGTGGTQFADDPDHTVNVRPGYRARYVRIWSGVFVDALMMNIMNTDGQGAPLDRHGGFGGKPQDFDLDDDEHITGITGRFGAVVDSIQFVTNKRRSPQYGGNGGNATYVYDVGGNEDVVGFFGRAGNLLDAIGVVVRGP